MLGCLGIGRPFLAFWSFNILTLLIVLTLALSTGLIGRNIEPKHLNIDDFVRFISRLTAEVLPQRFSIFSQHRPLRRAFP
jgi:hypothetical protein